MVRSRHQLVERLALVFHDWFATSNDGVGSVAFMIAQSNVFRATGLGSFTDLVRAVTTDPAMLIWLSGLDNRKNAVNENYARELMELFTLGADRGAYTETDVRELARSLSGWRADWVEGVGFTNFRWDQQSRWDGGTKTVFGQTGRWTWEDAVRLVLDHPEHASFFVRKLWSYFVPVPPSDAVSAALEQRYVASGRQIRPVLEAILCAPELYTGPAMVKPPVVFAAGLLRATGQGITTGNWSWMCDGAGQQLFRPPDVSGWDDARWLDTNTLRGRWDLVNQALEGHTVDPSSSSYAETADEAVTRARALLERPAAERRDGGVAALVVGVGRRRRRARLDASAAPERAADGPRPVPRPPGLLMPSESCTSCAEFSRASLLRGAVARAGGGLPSIEAGMPAPAGTGLSRRAFVTRSAGLALAVFGGSMLSPRAFEAGIDAAQAAGPGRVLVSVFLPGGLDALTLLSPVGHSAYATLRPTLAVPQSADARDAFSEDPTLQWHPKAAPLRDLHRAGRLTVMPAIGYDDPNQSHFTSRHYWEVGQLDPAGRIGWLGRYLDRHGAADNPLQGLALDYTLAPALAAASVPVAAVGQPEHYDFWTRDVWDSTMVSRMMAGWGALGDLATGDAELGAARAATRMTTRLRTQLAGMQGVDPYAAASATYPATTNPFPHRLAALAEMLDQGLPLSCVALEANGGYDTHEDQAGSLPGNLDLLSRSLAAFQADLEARGLADRVVTHVWSEFGRRARQNASGTDHGAGGLSLLMGTRVTGTMVGEFPGIASAQLDGDGNLRHTVDFRAVYTGLVEQWFGVDPAGIVPDAGAFTAPALIAA